MNVAMLLSLVVSQCNRIVPPSTVVARLITSTAVGEVTWTRALSGLVGNREIARLHAVG